MSKQYTGGLITKTPVVPTSLSAPGVWSLGDQAEAQSKNTWPFPRDPQFNYVTMLLHGDGSAGAVSMGAGAGASTTVTAFDTDASTNNFNITINGDARSNNFNPYQSGYYSNYFGGSGNSINYPSATQYAIGTGDFTLEFFVNFSVLNAGHNRMFAIGASGTDGLEIDLNGTNLEVGIQNGYPIGYTWTPTVNTWYYMAVTRSGSTVTLYINGTSVATGTSSNSISQNSLSIGGITWQSTWSINGFLSNVRLSNTVRTIATPTTPYTSDANTLFLGAQSNRFLDTSSYAATATATGSPQVAPAQPFTLPSSVATYGSGYFDGSGDYLTAPDSASTEFGSGDFTVECWVYYSSTSGTPVLIDKRANAGGYSPFIFYTTGGTLVFYSSSNGSSYDIANGVTIGSVTTGTWYHVAASRSGTSIRLFLNGVLGNTVTTSASLVNNSDAWSFGGTPGGNYLTGYLSNIRFVTGSAVYTSAFTPPTAPLTAITNTSLLTTQFNGAGNNSGFKDSSQNNFAITRNGNTTQGTFTPYSADWSNYLGSGNSFTLGGQSTFAFGTGDYTIECWFYKLSTAGSIITDFRPSSTNGLYPILSVSSSAVVFDLNGTRITSSTISLNTWTHMALVRLSGVTRLYINGVQSGSSYTDANNYLVGANRPAIGVNGFTPQDYFDGYISNFRIVKGVAVYTGSFTPSSTPLTAVTNTSLLTCQSNRFIDNSSNAYTLSIGGSPSVQGFSPFAPLTVYNPATYGGSAYFDGSGDYLNLGGQSAFAFGSSASFTIQFWFYATAISADVVFYDGRPTSTQGLYPTLYLNNSTRVVSYVTNSTEVITGSTTIVTGQWYYVTLSRNSGSTRLFVNGVQQGSTYADTITYANPASRPTIMQSGFASNGYLNGYVTDFQVLTGTGYSSVTVPTAPLTAITNTSLLLNFTNAGIFDNAMMNNLETVGNAQISTSVVKYGTASMYFDGSGDAVLALSNPQGDFGSGNFTLEGWFYQTATTNQGYFSKRANTSSFSPFLVQYDSNQLTAYLSTSGSSWAVAINASTNPSTNTWNHVAFVRNGSTATLYLNGTSVGSASISGSLMTNSTPVVIGAQASDASNVFNGYIDDLRITKGVARYTATFTPPTAAFPNG